MHLEADTTARTKATGWSKEPTAASFIRPDSKSIDKSRSLLSALKEKYGSENASKTEAEKSSSIVISGKTVDEVGFDVISKKQSVWSDLTVVSLDALRIDNLYDKVLNLEQEQQQEESQVLSSGLKWQELDLSRNLFAEWDDVTAICAHLEELRILKLNGNRFTISHPNQVQSAYTFKNLAELSLANCALEWDNIRTLCTHQRFPVLETLSLAFNPLSSSPSPFLKLHLPNLKTLDLTSCNLATLQTLSSLTHLPALSTFTLRSNPLTTLTTRPPLIFPQIKTLDLASTKLSAFSSLNPILTTFPILSSLKTSQTPLTASHPSSRLITIARLPGLTILNNTPIPPHERQNAELYYLNTITPLILAAKTKKDEKEVAEEHPQWAHLCEKYGEPESIAQKRNAHTSTSDTIPSTIDNSDEHTQKAMYPPLSLGANLINFTFIYHTPTPPPPPRLSTSDYQQCAGAPPPDQRQQEQEQQKQYTRSLPKQMDIYRLKAFVGRLFSIPSMELKLVLETDEWDPVPAVRPEMDDWSCSEAFSSESGGEDIVSRVSCAEGGEGEKSGKVGGKGKEKVKVKVKVKDKDKDKNLWTRREIELVDSTRPVSFWVEGKKARVRVERRNLNTFQ
ncbi:MAG: hypothetical protein Q9169_002856 [Polycauliona sp. 2 TL-2023]